MASRHILKLALAIVMSGSLCAPLDVQKQDHIISLPEFGRLMASLSEPEGYFDSDNFVSNEAAYLSVLPSLKRLGVHGGVYLGVGPDQNFSYIAAVQPALAVIIDIRRQNTLQHLYYKALFQLSTNRTEYLERLFGRPLNREARQPVANGISDLLERIARAPENAQFAARKVDEAVRVIHSWDLGLGAEDFASIRYVAKAFIDGGPDLKFTSYSRAPRPHHPSYRQLLAGTDSNGVQANFLAQDDRFQVVKRLQAENRILPIVGDLGGSMALPRTAAELRRRHLEVTCIYTSNVEFYLFGSERWAAYVRNIRALPAANEAYIIRSYANMWRPHPVQITGSYMTTLLQSVRSFLMNESAGLDETYWDLVTRSYVSP